MVASSVSLGPWALLAACLGLCGMAAAPALAMPTPPTSLVPVPREGSGPMARQAELLRRAREAEPCGVVFVGDSITQSWEGPGRKAWARHLAPLGAVNLGNSGDRTEHVLWRLAEAPLTRLEPKHVVLLIGTNNLGHRSSTAEETLAGIVAVAKMIEGQCPDARIHLLEVFPRGERMNAMRGEIAQINQALRRFVAAETAEEKSARYRIHAIGDRFVETDGRIPRSLMPDFLHLSPAGYQIWARAIVPELD